MAIVKRPTGKVQPPAPTPVHVAKNYQNITVDTQYTPQDSLLTHVEGSSWTIDYYSQVLDRDSGTAGQGLGTDPLYQQYKLIKSMEIRVTSPLTSSQRQDTSEMITEGTSTFYPFVIPNKGDMFVADLLDGRLGVFEVVDSRRLSIMREACHSVDYKLVAISDTVRQADLNSKVVQTVYFERDFIKHGQNPLLVEDDYENFQFLRRNYGLLINRFFKRFYSKEYGTIVMPDQTEPTYDHFLVKALFQHLDTWDAMELRDVRQLNVDDDQVMKADSLWSMLMIRDRSIMPDIFQQVGFVSSKAFTRVPTFEGIAYSGMKQVIYPLDATLRVDNQLKQNPKLAAGFEPERQGARGRKMTSFLNPNGGREPALDGIKHTFEEGYYVFSKAFYENDRSTENAQSDLELLVQDYLDKKEISYDRVRRLIEQSANWDSVDTFYYIPVLIILTKAIIRSI